MRAVYCTADKNNFPAENSSGMFFTAESFTGRQRTVPVSRGLLLWQKEKPFATTLFSQLHCEGLFLHKGGV